MTNVQQSKRRKAAASYYEKNKDALRKKARLRMRRLRASDTSKDETVAANAAASKRASQAKYRESRREILRAKEARRRVSKKVLAGIMALFPPADHVDAEEDNECSEVSDSGYLGDGNPSDTDNESEAKIKAEAKTPPIVPKILCVDGREHGQQTSFKQASLPSPAPLTPVGHADPFPKPNLRVPHRLPPMPPPDPHSSAYTRLRKRKRHTSPTAHDVLPPAIRPRTVVEIEGPDVQDELDVENDSDVPSEPDVENDPDTEDPDTEDNTTELDSRSAESETDTEEEDSRFAPDHYGPGLHYFHNRRCTNAQCRRDIPRKSLMRCGACYLVTYCTVDCQQADWKMHKRVCQLVSAEPHARAMVRFNYRYGRYIHALALFMFGYCDLVAGPRRDEIWKKRVNTHAVVLHVRQHGYTDSHHPYHDYHYSSCYLFPIKLLNIIEEGCRARAEALLQIRQEEKTCIVVIMFEDKVGFSLGARAFLHKVDEFEINQYARTSTYNAPHSFRRILLHKARKATPVSVIESHI
ncbi:hypothetical protein PC9H_001642 [Pleurotus ostreatus]|uniref:MYND-type domain-containing protein n=1 Tax=Pleurotus ostreatus TaxID=5322 RepID=A0A8H7DYW4_PLEOS|nr:uncharacterized protein PC9H_001642 [Pleurotus ostreatus]KAF7441293.1 hypothetical protein PC9H_001642 [Pleurotus ostreatus]